MARKPENSFIERVNSKLHPDVYHEKTNNPYRRGMPDVYYEGKKEILWIEYKFIDHIPKAIMPKDLLTANQYGWLMRNWENNKNCACIVGFPHPDGGVIFLPYQFDQKHTITSTISPREIASWISHMVL